MSGIIGSKLNHRGSGPVAKLGTDGQHLLSSGAGKSANYETVASATYDDDKIQSNIALLGFKTAVNGSLAKYNLQDQIIDEYEDATGIDAGASTNERLTSGVYDGTSTVTPTVTEDADDSGVDGDYTWYKWTDTAATGSYETDTTQDHEYLIVGAGASGGKSHAGGSGAGGVLAATGLSLTGGNEYTVTIGAGGAAITSGGDGNDGNDSILSGTGITTLTAGGGGANGRAGRATNGNGGGGGHNQAAGAGDGAGFAGGTGVGTAAPQYGGGGGGGAGAVGVAGTSAMTGTAGDGGAGVANDIIETGTDVYYAGGGGGSAYSNAALCGAGGNGGGGAGASGASAATAGTANTGGGGGGSHGGTSGAGGSGIVILRRLTTATSSGGDLTLQSTDTTASTANPDYADMVMLMENAEGTATINTDIKGYISEDSGVTFTEGTLVDEGTWGTDKKILAFHDLDISAQSGSAMCYKITTHNQSEGSKETKIHAVSIGWKA